MSTPNFLSEKLRAALSSPPAAAAKNPKIAVAAVEPDFVRDLIQRGEAVKLAPGQKELPPGATHEIVVDKKGQTSVVRRRFTK